MNRAALRLAALVLPIAGLMGAWIFTHGRAQQGTEWQVPVQGYDPRDLLRGHFITYRYDWPGLDDRFDAASQPFLCLTGKAPVIEITHPQFGFDDWSGTPDPQSCPHPVRADSGSTLDGGMLYVPQARAEGLEAKLRDPKLQGVVTIRLRDNGHFTPLRITFRPRPAQSETSTPDL